VVRVPAKTSPGTRAWYTPALARTTCRPSPFTSNASPSRGWNMRQSLGIRPSEGNV
jgi:hypothetical protein